MTRKEIITLIGTYITTTDSEVDDNEVRVIYQYNSEWKNIEEEISNITENNDKKITLLELLEKLRSGSKEEIYEAYQFFLELIYADSFYHEKERKVLETIRQHISITDEEFYALENKVSQAVKLYDEKEENFGDKFKAEVFGLMSKLSKKNKEKYNQKRQDILLNGPQFVEQIRKVGVTASHDLEFVLEKINSSSSRISQLIENLDNSKRQIKQADRKDPELEQFVNTLNEVVRTNAMENLKQNLEVLNKKKKSINYFSIAFLGRTKAGKSTLHSIITKEGADEIGVGKLRTTRLNRVYNWENLRIIDTPGIGAPGGQKDTEIAESIIDECDLICYVVTNDAIQETEFKFLAEIKKKNKPVLILLNVKENLNNEKRLKLFLKKPTKWLERSDEKSIQGHLNRIKEYMTKYYENCYYEVIPVMLLAASLADTYDDKKKKKILYNASNIESFLTGIKKAVFNYGHLRKSQNIIDGTNYRISDINYEFQTQLDLIDQIIFRLENDKKNFDKFLISNKRKYEKALTALTAKKFFKMEKFARDFSINNWELKKSRLQQKWEEDFKKRGFEKDLKNGIEREFESIQGEIQERIQEYKEGYQLFYNRLSFNIQTSSVFNMKKTWSLTAQTMGFASAILLAAGVVNPIIGIIGGISFVMNFSTSFFESKEKKKLKAQKKIEKSLLDSISIEHKSYEINVKENLHMVLNQYKKGLKRSLDELKEEATKLRDLLHEEYLTNAMSIDEFNRAILLRAFQQVNKYKFHEDIQYSLFQENKKKRNTISRVERDFKKNKFLVETDLNLNQQEVDELSRLLQSDFAIN